jgi:hypothetical protein
MQNQSSIFTQDAIACKFDADVTDLARELEFTEIMAIGGGENIVNNL